MILLNVNDKGEEITSCVAQPDDSEKTVSQVKLPQGGGQLLVLKALVEPFSKSCDFNNPAQILGCRCLEQQCWPEQSGRDADRPGNSLARYFTNYVKKALVVRYGPQPDLITPNALKAQAQCRTTVVAIVKIKYPESATFIEQQNVAH